MAIFPFINGRYLPKRSMPSLPALNHGYYAGQLKKQWRKVQRETPRKFPSKKQSGWNAFYHYERRKGERDYKLWQASKTSKEILRKRSLDSKLKYFLEETNEIIQAKDYGEMEAINNRAGKIIVKISELISQTEELKIDNGKTPRSVRQWEKETRSKYSALIEDKEK